MPSVPISRPGPIALAAVAALTTGVIPATAAVPADTAVRARFRRGGYPYSTAGVRTRTDTGLATEQGRAAVLLTPVHRVGVPSAA